MLGLSLSAAFGILALGALCASPVLVSSWRVARTEALLSRAAAGRYAPGDEEALMRGLDETLRIEGGGALAPFARQSTIILGFVPEEFRTESEGWFVGRLSPSPADTRPRAGS